MKILRRAVTTPHFLYVPEDCHCVLFLLLLCVYVWWKSVLKQTLRNTYKPVSHDMKKFCHGSVLTAGTRELLLKWKDKL